MSIQIEGQEISESNRNVVKSGEFYCNKIYRENEKSLSSFKPVIKKLSPVASEIEKAHYRERCRDGKIKDVEERIIAWTELLQIRNTDPKSFIGKESKCRLECLEIIDKDVPRSLHDLYKDPDEKVG